MPSFVTKVQVRREVRSRVNDEVGYYGDVLVEGEYKEVTVKVKRKTATLWGRRLTPLLDFFQVIDWRLLRKQKEGLLKGIFLGNDEHYDGVIAFIDAVQDTAVDSGMFTEFEVFGELHDR